MTDSNKRSAPEGIPRRRLLAMGLGGATLSGLGVPLRLRAAPERVDVAIVGAGLAGLNAAIMLEELGASVRLLEAGQQPGGRCLTRDMQSHAIDVGASQIGASYARVHDMCRRLGVELAPGAHLNAPYAPVVGGRLIPAGDWPDSTFNLTQGAEREVMPHALTDFYVGQRTPFDGINEWRSPEAAQYDISIADWLQQQGASPEAVRIIFESNGRMSLEQQSILRMLQELTRGKAEMQGFSEEQRRTLDHYEIASLISSHVVGGTSRLTDAMAAQVGDNLRLASRVTAIDKGPTGCRLQLADGAAVSADFAILALPFSTLRNIRFTPALQGTQAEAITDMVYNNQSQIWFGVKAPYWEEDGIEASMWTDGPLQLIRQQIEPDGSRTVMSAIASGSKAASLDAMPSRERGEFALREIARIRPSTKGKLEVLGTFSWREGRSAGGCSFTYPVGRVLDWVHNMGKPHGRIHFAGEHLRQVELGMEAAMASGERAAIDIAARVVA
ncbi:MAG: flavin monoamine oxidase family protein [Chromatocurvus sp.]